MHSDLSQQRDGVLADSAVGEDLQSRKEMPEYGDPGTGAFVMIAPFDAHGRPHVGDAGDEP